MGFEDEIDSKIFKDVISALDGLGYKEKESKKALKQLGMDKSDNSNHTIENLIREVLKILNEEHMHTTIFNTSYAKVSKSLKKVHFDNDLQVFLLKVIDEIEKVSGKYLAIRPRVQLQNLAKVYAALKSRTFVVPEDILALLLSSMRHRFHEMSKQEIEEMILKSVSPIKLP